MAADIRAAASSSSPPDALIVTIPEPTVQEAVEEVLDLIPVFGFNSVPKNYGILIKSLKGFVHMNEFIGGRAAGEYIQGIMEASKIPGGRPKGLFVNHVPGNDSNEERENGIIAATEGFMEWDVYVEALDEAGLTAALADCTYTAIQLAGFASMNATLAALDNNECLENERILGTFDVTLKYMI